MAHKHYKSTGAIWALVVTIVFAFSLPGLARADKTVDLELVLLSDASGSIDDAEILFQRRGYASALLHPDVQQAIFDGLHGAIALTFVEWGDSQNQEIVVPWRIIRNKSDAEAFAKAILTPPRRAFGYNAIGAALSFAQDMIEKNDIKGIRRVIDLSADSANSWDGIPIASARARALAGGITINGLAILCRAKNCSGQPIVYDLETAFRRDIIAGTDSFVITADGPVSFAAAVRKKLILEIAQRPAKQPLRPKKTAFNDYPIMGSGKP